MNQLVRLWNSLRASQRISLIAAPLLICGLVFGLIKWKHETGFRTLYTSLAPEDASAVAAKIREAGIEYRLDETGSTVLVPVAQLAEARLAVAAAGLPHSGRIGFELFDRTNLGASDFAEQVNFKRALEGELERTVSTLSEVGQARIHITFAKESVFLDARQPAKATVVLQLKRTGHIEQSNVTAIANLVASAVDGLSPESVAIIDSSGRLLNRPRSSEDGEARIAEANLDYRHQIESELLAKINASLEPLLGAGRFRAGLNVDCDFSTIDQSDEIFDSSKSAILQSQTTEESTSSGASGGTPGTAANLPQPPARAAGGQSGILRRTENTSFQPGRTVRHTVAPKGTLRRISTAVLIDQTVRWDGIGPKVHKTLVPPSADVLKGVHDIIASVTGFSEQRGDQITVETLPFESTLSAEPPLPMPSPSKTQTAFDFKQPFVIGGVVALLLIVAAGFLLARRTTRVPVIAKDAAPAAIGAGQTLQTLETSSASDNALERQIADNEAQQAQIDAEALNRIKLPARSNKTEVLARHIRTAVEKDPLSAANLLRTWVTESEGGRT
jgi:flagellar M-ring protein FliF